MYFVFKNKNQLIYSSIKEAVQELHEKGFVVIEGSFSSISDIDDLLADVLGNVIPHYRHSSGLSNSVTISTSAYSDSKRPQSNPSKQTSHTDGCFEKVPPAFLALACVEPAFVGGTSTIVDSEDIYFDFKENKPHLLPALFDEQCYEITRGEKTVSRPVFKMVKSGCKKIVQCTFSSHEFNSVSVKPDCRESFERFKELLVSGTYTKKIKLSAGQILVANNLRVLHGRTCWTDNEFNARHLERLWFNGKSPFTKQVNLGFKWRQESAQGT